MKSEVLHYRLYHVRMIVFSCELAATETCGIMLSPILKRERIAVIACFTPFIFLAMCSFASLSNNYSASKYLAISMLNKKKRSAFP